RREREDKIIQGVIIHDAIVLGNRCSQWFYRGRIGSIWCPRIGRKNIGGVHFDLGKGGSISDVPHICSCGSWVGLCQNRTPFAWVVGLVVFNRYHSVFRQLVYICLNRCYILRFDYTVRWRRILNRMVSSWVCRCLVYLIT